MAHAAQGRLADAEAHLLTAISEESASPDAWGPDQRQRGPAAARAGLLFRQGFLSAPPIVTTRIDSATAGAAVVVSPKADRSSGAPLRNRH